MEQWVLCVVFKSEKVYTLGKKCSETCWEVNLGRVYSVPIILL